MIGFTSSEVHIFICKVTKQNETIIVPRKTYWKVPRFINKIKKTVIKTVNITERLKFAELFNYINYRNLTLRIGKTILNV